MPGPPPTPSEVLRARGSWRAKTRKGEPTDEVAVPTCPDHLDGEAKAEWKRLAKFLKDRRTISKACRGLLAGMCSLWSAHVKATKKVSELMDNPESSATTIRRWAAIQSDTFKVYLWAAQEFGIPPASRSRVEAIPERPASGVISRNRDGDKSRFFRGDNLDDYKLG
jgi:P27 family predicted phage terminase small subunit